MQTKSLIGKSLTCAETGKQFLGASDGFTTNYARDNAGNIYSDEGVVIREERDLLNRSKPFFCYLSGDGKHVMGWKGNLLGKVTQETKGGGFSNSLTHIRVTDIHGNTWYGKGAGRGMCITLRATKQTKGFNYV